MLMAAIIFDISFWLTQLVIGMVAGSRAALNPNREQFQSM